jgi:16S rRNA (adenine1518-N6/adenine1519-N6)-dimethyltransferase
LGRRLGQHFLERKSILDRIAAAALDRIAAAALDRIAAAAVGEESSVASAGRIIEIGPGRGSLTQALLEGSADSTIIAIEVDPVLVHYLHQKFRTQIEAGRLEVIQGDVLKTDLAALAAPERAVIAGNLPYYITSPILSRVFALGEHWKRAVFLVQAEVAARLAAAPGGRDYGYLSVLTQVHARPRILCDVPRSAFRPPPKVDSAVVLLEPLDPEEAWQTADREGFLRFASDCFLHKRKTLRNNLAPRYGRERMDALVEGKLRAEQLSVAQLAALYRQLGWPAASNE